MERWHQAFDEVAEVALAAANGDFAKALQITDKDWTLTRRDYPALDPVVPERICRVVKCDWPTVVRLSFMPSLSRLLARGRPGRCPSNGPMRIGGKTAKSFSA
jgi:hypothetical protein